MIKIKHYFLALTFLFLIFNDVVAQSQDQNYIKTTEYLETVMIDSEFTSSFGGWLPRGSVDLSLENGRVKANVNSAWEGVEHSLTGFVTSMGEVLNISITLDKGNTQSNVRIYFKETDPNGNLVNYRTLSSNVQSGTHQYSHTMLTTGNSMTLNVDKDDTNTSSNTYFYIDHISLKQGGVANTIEKIENVTYFDGFGKVKQSIGVKQTPNQKDILQHVEYDEFGRASKQYLVLPTAQNSGNYISNPVSQITNYYQSNFADQHPYSEVRYDNSPLNRKLESTSPGDAWQIINNSDTDHTAKYEYGLNTTNEVFRIDINENNASNPFAISYYARGELIKNTIKNANWKLSDGLLNTKDVFTDKNGKKIVEFSYENNNGTIKKLSTYYVYDDNSNLRYVLTPKLVDQIQGVTLDDYYETWLENDFLEQGDAGLLNTSFSVINNRLSFRAKRLHGGLSLSQKILKNQTVKILNTSSPIPDMVLGPINAYFNQLVDPSGNPISAQIGVAKIVNGNLVIDRTSAAAYDTISIAIYIDLNIFPVDQQQLDDLAFQYKYDEFNRQIEQKVPGKDWEYVVYDQLDRPILTQDANLRGQDNWLFNKYDVFGRVIYSGLYTNSATRVALQTQVDDFINSNTNKANVETRTPVPVPFGGVNLNYSIGAFPNNNVEVLTVNYFDDYNFTDSSLPTMPTQILGQEVTDRTKGLLTATWTKVLGSTNVWSKSYTFYNKKAQVIDVYEKNHLGGYTENKSKLDFRGKVEESETNHKRLNSSTNLKIVDYFEYDHVERPTKHYQKINSQQEELISLNTYNELGQLESKKVGGANSSSQGLQTMDYTYNIKGWLTNLNDVNSLGADLFAYNLKYNDAIEGSAVSDPMYNGNIRQSIWKSAHNNTKKSYVYNYDKLNRFERSNYREGNTLTSGAGKFETYSLRYDTNGNIKTLSRNNQSGTQMDKLGYAYDDGNKLLSIGDLTNNTSGFNDGYTAQTGSFEPHDYYYDSNGNLIKDKNKNISLIEYNHLDLVERVTIGIGRKIEFTYDANGTKLQMKMFLGNKAVTVDYLGGFQYVSTRLLSFPTAEGYVINDVGTYKYVYTYSDHLGNNRLSYHDSDNSNTVSSSEIQSNTDYYAMGLIHDGQYVSGYASRHNYKFQGKELLNYGDYNMYDFGSRMYDPSVGRWFNTDPQNQFSSPYLAMGNNPVMFIDPNGEIVPLLVIAGAAVIGGAINVAANWDRIDNFWEGLGHFGTGAGTGVASVTMGPAGAVAVSTLAGALDEAIQGGDASQIFQGGVQAGIGSGIGLGVGKYIGKGSNLLFNKWKVTSPFLKNLIGGSIGGSIGGGLTGGLFSAGSGGDFWDGVGQGAKTGLIYGGISGGGNSIFQSYAHNTNPFTGKAIDINKVKIRNSGVNRIKNYLRNSGDIDFDMANEVMIRRLDNITSGRLNATSIDKNFYTHELREMYLKNFNGLNHNKAHEQSLKDYNIDYKKYFYNQIYTKEAIRTGDAYFKWKETNIID
ncbi:DUF6443 domain-containing protein [Winogradskyella sp. PC D3.3]